MSQEPWKPNAQLPALPLPPCSCKMQSLSLLNPVEAPTAGWLSAGNKEQEMVLCELWSKRWGGGAHAESMLVAMERAQQSSGGRCWKKWACCLILTDCAHQAKHGLLVSFRIKGEAVVLRRHSQPKEKSFTDPSCEHQRIPFFCHKAMKKKICTSFKYKSSSYIPCKGSDASRVTQYRLGLFLYL